MSSDKESKNTTRLHSPPGWPLPAIRFTAVFADLHRSSATLRCPRTKKGDFADQPSLFAQDSNTLMGYATSPISSRFLDAVLTQSAVPSKYKRMLMNGFMGRYKFLVEDRMGSRVGDTIWDHADGFMKVSPFLPTSLCTDTS